MIIKEKNAQTIKKTEELARDLYLSLLHEGKFIYLDIYGMSMYPFIKNGDRIKVEPVNEKDIKIGNIIALNMKDKNRAHFVVHRIVKIISNDGNRIYFTKGDFYTENVDGPVTLQSIAGKISEIQRKNIKFNLKCPLWKFFNFIIAKLSLRRPNLLRSLSRLVNLVIEHKLILFKVKNRLKKGNPVLYNTEELLLICARKDLDERFKTKAAELIKEGVDWKYFYESAISKGVTILVYRALKTIASYVRVPQYVRDTLKSTYLFIISRTVVQYKELMELLSLFAKNDIPVIPLKGLLLSKRLYDDIAARGLSVDFDLLIEEKDREKAQILLEKVGYSFNPDDEIKEWQWQHNFFKVKKTTIDLHWDVTMMGRSHERIEGFWKGTRMREEDNVRYYEFEEEELLLYLSLNFINSGHFGQFRYVYDINELVRKYKDVLDWANIIKKAKRWRVSNSLYAALELSKNLLSLEAPLEVLKKLKPSFLKLILIKTLANRNVILRDCLRRRLIDKFFSYIFFELLEAKHFSEYTAIIKRVLFPPKEVLLKAGKDMSKPIFLLYTTRLFKAIFKVLDKVFIS